MDCKAEGCERKAVCKECCSKHYEQLKKYGKILKYTLADFNEVVDKGTYYELVLLNNKSEEIGRCKIDKEDLQKVNKHGRWGLKSDGYVYNKKAGYIHRIIMNAKDDEQVDHRKVGIKYRSDNRKKKLRLCSQTENQHNKTKTSRNTSGYKGVSWDRKAKKWKAAFEYKGESIYVGLFDTAEEAYRAYCKKARKVIGKYFRG